MDESNMGMDQRRASGIPSQIPFKYSWDQVKDRITEEELERLHQLVDLSVSWTGEDDPNYREWLALDLKAWPLDKREDIESPAS